MNRPWLDQYDDGVPHTVDVPDEPLHFFLDRAARTHPTRPAIRFLTTEVTYRDLKTEADAFAAALQSLGVEPGSRVMLLLPNVPQAVIAFYGALQAGAVVVLSNPTADAALLSHQINDCGADTVVTVGAALGAVVKARETAHIPRIIRTRIREYLPPLRSRLMSVFGDKGHFIAPSDSVALADLLQKHRGQPSPPISRSPEDIAVLCYTGGTTGTPRAVMLTHRNLVADTLQVRAFYTQAREGQETLLAALPFWHSYGLTAGLNLSVLLAGSLLLVPDFRPGEVLRLISRHRPTLFPGVPAMYVSLINHPEVKQHPLSAMHAISGAAPLPVEVKEAFERLGKGRLVEGYGLTEAAPVTHANPIMRGGRSGSIGVPLPSTDAVVVDPRTGAALEPGEIGELRIRGPQVMRGYWNRPQETAAALRDGWLCTGDLATMDPDGYFRIICRKSDVIPVDGRELYPRDVEEVLYEHPSVREAAVMGDDGAITAHVALRRGRSATESDLITFCRQRLSPWKVPARVVVHEKLPRTSIGKILRRLL